MPTATHHALKDLGNVAGSAAALQRSLQMVFGAIAAAAVGLVGENSLISMACVMTMFAIITLVLLALSMKTQSRSSSVAPAYPAK